MVKLALEGQPSSGCKRHVPQPPLLEQITQASRGQSKPAVITVHNQNGMAYITE